MLDKAVNCSLQIYLTEVRQVMGVNRICYIPLYCNWYQHSLEIIIIKLFKVYFLLGTRMFEKSLLY